MNIEVRYAPRAIPEWFLKELKLIDPTYFVVYNPKLDYFEMKKRVQYSVTDGFGKIDNRVETPTLAVFKHLNDRELNKIRERKYLGRRFERQHNPHAYLDWINAQNKEAKEKMREVTAERMAEGLMKIVKHGDKKIFV